MNLRNKALSVFFLMVGVIAFAPVANAGLFDFLFPKMDTSPDPSETLRAPFANEDAVIQDLDSKGNPEKTIPLNLRHRPNTLITKWVKMVVPFLLSYKADTYEQDYGKKIVNFNKVGLDEYVGFLHKKNVLKILKTGRYNVAGIIQNYPVLLNEGAVDGRYRWVFKVDILITYFDNGMKKYTQAKEGDTITQEFTVTMQIGRNKGVDNEHSILIETWDAVNKKP